MVDSTTPQPQAWRWHIAGRARPARPGNQHDRRRPATTGSTITTPESTVLVESTI